MASFAVCHKGTTASGTVETPAWFHICSWQEWNKAWEELYLAPVLIERPNFGSSSSLQHSKCKRGSMHSVQCCVSILLGIFGPFSSRCIVDGVCKRCIWVLGASNRCSMSECESCGVLQLLHSGCSPVKVLACQQSDRHVCTAHRLTQLQNSPGLFRRALAAVNAHFLKRAHTSPSLHERQF